MGRWLSVVAGRIIEEKQTKFRHQMATKDLTIRDLEVMDEDGDGVVTQIEFLEFMLVAMNKVDKDTLVELREHFEHLDADGTGTLTKADLFALPKRNLMSQQRKLELSWDKQQSWLFSDGDGRPRPMASFWNRANGTKRAQD